MRPSHARTVVGLAVLLAVATGAQAQRLTPRVGYVYPAGGRQGHTFQVVLGGQSLDGVTNAFVSGAGVQVKVLGHTKPLTPQQVNALREKLKELQDKKSGATRTRPEAGAPERPDMPANLVWTAEDEKTLAEVRKKLAGFQRRPANPAIAEIVTLEVTMAPDAPPGARELRLGTPSGLSNPLVFCVGQLPEIRERESNRREEPRGLRGPLPSRLEAEMPITLPAIVNGQIMPGDVDRYRFQARAGQQLVVAASARELIPYLSDAVPGWFQATLALCDAKGRELAYNDDFRFKPDPVLSFKVPKDGEYMVEIKDAVYRGRDDFVYRLAVGELPYVTSIFPLGGKAGAPTTVELEGWNLPVTKLTVEDRGPGVHPVSVRREEQISNRVPFAVDTLPECLEAEPNDQPQSAQQVALPVIVNGRVNQPGDWDVVRFEGRAGEEIVAEVWARRLDSPLDSVLRLTDANGQQLAFSDDFEDKGAGLNTHHADSWLRATLPASGTYYVHLGDAQHKGGLEYAYRLRLSPPRPDFELRVVPSSLSVRGGMSVPLTLYALRKDGFTDEIELALKDAPAGFTLSGGQVPARQDQVRCTLTAPPRPRDEPYSLSLEGRARIQGRLVERLAVPADDMMQAFAYHHLVPAQGLAVEVSGRSGPRAAVRILGATPVRIPANGTARVRITAPPGPGADRFQLELSEPPDGLALESVNWDRGVAELLLQGDAARLKPGLKGNLIVNILGGRAPALARPGPPLANRRRPALGTLPAIPFEIVAP